MARQLRQARCTGGPGAQLPGRLGQLQPASNGCNSASLDAAIGPDGEDDATALAEFLGVEDPALELSEDFHTLAPLLVELDDRSRRILHRRFVEEMTPSETGEELGISRMHVSRLLSRNLEHLRKGMPDQS
ncbi:sigma-70 family RNA polymerase sigma factor [Streptomyces sp. NPDC046182]|uniref:sigma-70 family RNA polymerase sigma factor n=1 Tax=Streptomyces sp. NPDC046182 TaxID=3154601 RepID=UPI0033DD09DF